MNLFSYPVGERREDFSLLPKQTNKTLPPFHNPSSSFLARREGLPLLHPYLAFIHGFLKDIYTKFWP
ncbi:hypothetical protein K7X08_035672 [Anisodus acutangulus]|uniref:Uncharacterized protein n=1 Tax=Anisodus acutangulus TaxID=402998 RepID=A0A9Q1MFL9_9SOLA|nr:hypothetical protein K7X08_035672 [Anisodus acutangulus]